MMMMMTTTAARQSIISLTLRIDLELVLKRHDGLLRRDGFRDALRCGIAWEGMACHGNEVNEDPVFLGPGGGGGGGGGGRGASFVVQLFTVS